MNQAPKRTLAITKRVDLSDISEGWDGAYAIVKPAKGAQLLEVADLKPETMKNSDVLAYELKVVKDNFISGMIKLYGVDGLADMLPEDLDESPLLTDRLYAAIMGADLDPKGMPKAAPSTSAPSTDSSPSTTS